MTTYTFNPTSLSQISSNWDDPTIWAGRKVPNGAAADVIFPVITNSGGMTVSFEITIGSKTRYSIRSLTMQSNYLVLDGSLAVSGAVDLEGASEIDLFAGALNAGSITVDGTDLQGHGRVDVGALVDDTEIIGNNLTVSATSFTNNGQLIAISGNLIMTVNAGGFTNLVDGTLTGGTYRAGLPGGGAAPSYTLYLNVGQLLTEDAADIEIDDGGAIKFFDSSTSKYVPIQTTLRTVAETGSLTLSGQSYKWGDLDVEGALSLGDNAIFRSSDLTIGATGVLSGTGTVDSPIVNNGRIFVTVTELDDSSGTQDIVLNGAVTGTGGIEIGGVLDNEENSNPNYFWVGATVELNGATSQNVTFEQSAGTLQLDRPSTFKGTIIGASEWTYFILENVSLSSVINYSYSGDAEGGTLHIRTTAGNYALNFEGDYTAKDFKLAAGPQELSTSPPSLAISLTVAPPPKITGAVADQEIVDKQTVDPFSTVTIADQNVDSTGRQLGEHVTVTLSNPSDGSLSNLGPTGSYDAATGVYTAFGTAADVTSYLQGLVFTPSAAPGKTTTTSFTIEVDDGVSTPATDTTTSVVTSSVSGGGQTVSFCGAPGNAASLYDTGGDFDTLSGSNGTAYLTNAQAFIIGGDDVLIFLGASDDAVNLSSTNGAWDSVYGSNGAVTLNSAEAAIVGGGDTVTLQGSSSVSLASTGGNWDGVYGSNQTIILNSAEAGVVGGGDTLWLSGTSSVSLASTNGDWDAVNGANQTEILDGADATLIGDGNLVYLGGANGLTLSGSSDQLITGQALGQDWITGFDSSDKMQFSASNFQNFAALQNAMSQSGANTIITLDSNASVTLYNVQASSLQSSQFSFV